MTRVAYTVLLAAFSAASAVAQSPAASSGAASAPAVRPLGPITLTSPLPIGEIWTVHELPDRRVIINTPKRRQVVVYDSALAKPAVILDATVGQSNSYGQYASPLIPGNGDTVFFLTYESASLLAIGPDAAIAGVRALPRASDASAIRFYSPGMPAFDPRGRLVYFLDRRRLVPAPQMPDSVPVVRVDMNTRTADTAGMMYVPTDGMIPLIAPNGRMGGYKYFHNPVPVPDRWALLTDGTIAIVRGRSYSVDWLHPDGTRTTTARVPFPWVRITDEMKMKIVDSVAAYVEAVKADSMRQKNYGAASHELPVASDLPDYFPAIRDAVSDREGRLWVRTTHSLGADRGFVYDVLTPQKGLIDRVELPKGAYLAAFGARSTIYLLLPDGRLARAQYR